MITAKEFNAELMLHPYRFSDRELITEKTIIEMLTRLEKLENEIII